MISFSSTVTLYGLPCTHVSPNTHAINALASPSRVTFVLLPFTDLQLFLSGSRTNTHIFFFLPLILIIDLSSLCHVMNQMNRINQSNVKDCEEMSCDCPRWPMGTCCGIIIYNYIINLLSMNESVTLCAFGERVFVCVKHMHGYCKTNARFFFCVTQWCLQSTYWVAEPPS